MPIYSHSQLSMYENCPLKYKLRYRDKIKLDIEGVEGFMGLRVHETLKKLYDDIRLTKVDSLTVLLSYYDKIWRQNWHDSILIVKKDLTKKHYHALGKKMIEIYYQRYSPFDSDVTIGTEMSLNFALDIEKRYRMMGYVDRLSRTVDGIYQIRDYKTSAHLSSQEDADNDRQLGLYQIGIQKKWPDIKNINLVWHYLAFDRELTSSRSEQSISKLKEKTIRLIDEMASVEDFPPRESGLCDWCEYQDLCPMRKHFYTVETLPVNEYLKEPGVVLVNKYAELKEKASEIDEQIEKVREAILDYARREQVQVIKGSDRKARVNFIKKLKFPSRIEEERQELDNVILEAGKWMEVSQLDITALTRAIEGSLWDKELIDEVLKYGRIEETSSIYLSRLKDEGK
ncbi:MAG TPA: PD-(D/E)XK nuclease family protein [Dehalococcoidia bacterium]|nr:PD-(D/E)XK nuclease family protein [Dehalococcoidia bacterium]